jgi:hypothetical protein
MSRKIHNVQFLILHEIASVRSIYRNTPGLFGEMATSISYYWMYYALLERHKCVPRLFNKVQPFSSNVEQALALIRLLLMLCDNKRKAGLTM